MNKCIVNDNCKQYDHLCAFREEISIAKQMQSKEAISICSILCLYKGEVMLLTNKESCEALIYSVWANVVLYLNLFCSFTIL